MDLATLELLAGIDFWVIMIILAAFFVSIPICRAQWFWPHLLPLLAVVLYVPYEMYFAIEEVSLGVPIRIDLLLLLPAFGLALPISALMWWLVALRQRKEKGSKGILAPSMALAMLGFTIAAPIYVKLHLIG